MVDPDVDGGRSKSMVLYRIMPAPTVSFVDSSMRMNEPVARLLPESRRRKQCLDACGS